MTLTLAPPTKVHEDRMGATKTSGPNRLIVLHTTEGWEGVDRAEQLAAACTQRGDRPSGSGFYGSSYHYVIDTDRVIPLVPENRVSYSAPGANNDGIHVVFPGKAGQTRADWLDTISAAYIEQCAELMVWISKRTGIPLVFLTAAEVVAGKWGFCDHGTISRAYKRTDHTDVGPNFPWDVLAGRIRSISSPDKPTTPEKPPTTPTEADMSIAILELEDAHATFIGPATVSGGLFQLIWADGREPEQIAALDLHKANPTTVYPGPGGFRTAEQVRNGTNKYNSGILHSMWVNRVPQGDGLFVQLHGRDWDRVDVAGVV